MPKLCSNGIYLQTLFPLHLKRLVSFSTYSANGVPSSMVDYMVKTLGFSRDEAVTAWNKVSPAKFKSSEKPELVVDFLKQRGLDNTQIKKIVSSMPDLLSFKVDKTLMPKFNALEELGILGSDLADVIASNPSILRRGLTTRIIPMISFVKSIMGINEHFFRILRRSYWLMSSDVATVLQPNMELFRNYGLSDERILKMLVQHAEIFGHDPKRLGTILLKVEEELGIPRKSSVFTNAIVLLASLSEKTIESKCQIFRSFGWTDLDIKTMVRKLPRSLMLSEAIIRDRLNFFMNELGCEPEYLASRPYVLTYSMEERVLPRYTILKVLKEKRFITVDLGVLAAVCTSEPRFLEQYVLPHQKELPELCEAYICRKKGASVRGRPRSC